MLKAPSLPLPGLSGCLQCNKNMSGRAVSKLRLKEVMLAYVPGRVLTFSDALN